MTDRVIQVAALILLVFTPLAFGTVQPWSEAIAELLVLVMAVAWVLGMVQRWEFRVTLPPGWLPAMLFLGLVAAQTIPLPAGLLDRMAPMSAALYHEAQAFTGGPAAAAISIAPHETARLALKLLAVAVLFLVLHNTIRTREQAVPLVWAMVLTVSAIAVLGIVQRATWTGRLYWIGPPTHAAAFGPFVNRTHFAALTIVTVPMALALVLSRRREPTARRRLTSWGTRLRHAITASEGPTRLLGFLVLVMGGATLVTGSRGGVVSLLVSLLVMIGLQARGPAARQRALRLAMLTALIVLAGVWIGGDILQGTIERLAEEIGRPEDSTRARLWHDAIALWQRAPVVGTGLATFEWAFPRFRTLPAPVAFTHAESDWIQLLTDTGATGVLLALATLGTLLATLLRRLPRTTGAWDRAFLMAGTVALAGTAVQGIGNFNLVVLSIPVYAATAVAVALRGASRGLAPGAAGNAG